VNARETYENVVGDESAIELDWDIPIDFKWHVSVVGKESALMIKDDFESFLFHYRLSKPKPLKAKVIIALKKLYTFVNAMGFEYDRVLGLDREMTPNMVYYSRDTHFYKNCAVTYAQMVEAVVRDQKRIFPVCAWLQGEYGMSDIYLGVPVVLGKNGIEKIIELQLTEAERALLVDSAEAVKGVMDVLDNMNANA
jgi:hypothetical protein